MKYKNLSKEEQKEIDEVLDFTCKPKELKVEGFGLCSTCSSLNLVKSEFKIIKSYCNNNYRLPFTVTTEEPIKFCNNYSKRGEMSLYEMGQIALSVWIKKKGRLDFD